MVQKTLQGERGRERWLEMEEKLLLCPAVFDSLCLKSQLGQTGACSAAVAWRGEKGKECESTRQGQNKDRPQAYCSF